MVTDVRAKVDEGGVNQVQDDSRALGVIRRLLLVGFVMVLLLEAWLAWEFYQTLV